MGSRLARFIEAVRAARERGGVALMGVCNVTPDSFSDGGLYLTPELAFRRIDALVAEGADVVDVGGESTRPGAPRVAPSVQLERVLEVVSYAKERVVVSVDTTSAEVAEACLRAGAHAVNDVSLLSEPGLADVVARHGAALVLSHARGFQAGMAGFGRWPESDYVDVISEVVAEWSAAAAEAERRGVPREALVMDPGLGFSKSARHSLALLRGVARLAELASAPVLVGASRKSFLTLADPGAGPPGRLGASLAAALHAARCGASLLRVHDVRATRQALSLAQLLSQDPAGRPDERVEERC